MKTIPNILDKDYGQIIGPAAQIAVIERYERGQSVDQIHQRTGLRKRTIQTIINAFEKRADKYFRTVRGR